MTANPVPLPRAPGSRPLPADLLPALALLLKAADGADDVGHPLWDFAVEVSLLRAAGLTDSELRWLACRGLAEHAVENAPPTRRGRSFTTPKPLLIESRTCVVPTPAGIAAARAAVVAEQDRLAAGGPTSGPPPRRTSRRLVPFWDPGGRILWLGQQVVKQLRPSAGNQELILMSFQELGWPPRIDDPLPGAVNQVREERLRQTVKNLSRRRAPGLLLFRADASGRGVRWLLPAVRPR